MQNLTALVVEDDVDIACIFGKALQKAGFEVEVTHSGTQALVMLSSIVPTLVVLDISLPGVSGTEILDDIKRDARFAKTFVIIATAYAHMIQSAEEKADLVLLKPVSYSQMRDLSKRLATTVN